MIGMHSKGHTFACSASSCVPNLKVHSYVDHLLAGVVLYTRAMYVFYCIMKYWEDNNLPIFALFRASPTFFSEESGEIALSLLTRSRPANMRCDYEQTRKAWLLTKQMYSASHDAKADLKMGNKDKTHRTIGNT